MLGLNLHLIPLRLAFHEHMGSRLDFSRAYGKSIRLHQRWRVRPGGYMSPVCSRFQAPDLIIVLPTVRCCRCWKQNNYSKDNWPRKLRGET